MAAPQVYQTGANIISPLVGTERVSVDNGFGGNDVATAAAISLLSNINPLMVNTTISTVGAGTLTAAALLGSVITRTGSTAAYTDTTDTAALIIAALPAGTPIGTAFKIYIRNTVPFTETLAGGTGVTLSGITIVPPNSMLEVLLTYATATTVTIFGIDVGPLSTVVPESATALNTVGAGTITGAGIAGGVTVRGGAQSATPFTDTTDTAANIIAAEPNANIGQSWEWTYQNNTNANATLANGTGVTVSAVTIIPANTWARFLVTYTAAATVTIVGIAMGQNAMLPVSQFVTIAAGNGTLAAGNMEGAAWCTLASSGATAMTTRTAAQIIAGVPNMQIGDSYMLWVFNSNGGTLTLTGGTNVTITGTATIATNICRLYNVSMTGAAAITMQNCGAGVAS